MQFYEKSKKGVLTVNEIKVLDLAKYIIDKCVKDKKPISNLQLQKILYYVQVAFIKEQKTPLFKEEIEAWQFGPVVPIVYGYFCGFGSLRIRVSYDDVSLTIDSKSKAMLDKIIEEKREQLPWQLVKDTHNKDKAWSRVYKEGQGNKKTISTELMAACG